MNWNFTFAAALWHNVNTACESLEINGELETAKGRLRKNQIVKLWPVMLAKWKRNSENSKQSKTFSLRLKLKIQTQVAQIRSYFAYSFTLDVDLGKYVFFSF